MPLLTYADVSDLISAAGKGDIIKIRTLFDKGTDVNGKNRNDRTALISAAMNGQYDEAKLFIDRVADVNAKNENGRTAWVHQKHSHD